MHAESKTRADRRANRMHDDRTFRNKKPVGFLHEFCRLLGTSNVIREFVLPRMTNTKTAIKSRQFLHLKCSPADSGLMRNAAQSIGRQRRFVLP